MGQESDVGTAHNPRTLEIHLWEDRWGNHHAKVVAGPGASDEFRFARCLNDPGDDPPLRELLSNSLPYLAAALDREGL